MAKTKQLHVSRFDPELKARLIEEADRAEISLNDYAVGVLADHFKVSFKGTGRKSPGAKPGSGAIMLPVPVPLYNRIKMETLRQPTNQQSIPVVVEAVMRDHFAKLDAERAAEPAAVVA